MTDTQFLGNPALRAAVAKVIGLTRRAATAPSTPAPKRFSKERTLAAIKKHLFKTACSKGEKMGDAARRKAAAALHVCDWCDHHLNPQKNYHWLEVPVNPECPGVRLISLLHPQCFSEMVAAGEAGYDALASRTARDFQRLITARWNR